MKAEERKELETNVLADKLGKVVQTVKGGPNRRAVFWVLILGVIAVVGFFYVRNRALSREEKMQGWAFLGSAATAPDHRRGLFLEQTRTSFPREKAGLTAWLIPIVQGGQMNVYTSSLPSDLIQPLKGLKGLAVVGKFLSDQEDAMKDEPLLQSQMAYLRCVILETQALLDSSREIDAPALWKDLDPQGTHKTKKFLDAAKDEYERVATEFKDTPMGLLAQERLDRLNNTTEFEQIRQFYDQISSQLVRAPIMTFSKFPHMKGGLGGLEDFEGLAPKGFEFRDIPK